LINSNNLLDESQRIAQTGSWKYNIKQMVWSGQKDIIVFWIRRVTWNELNDAYRSRIYPADLIVLDELSENIVKQVQILKLVIE
jgi:hypothetical protein